MQPLKKEYRWYVLYTHCHHEAKAYEYLLRNSIEAYLPLHPVVRQWTDRKKIIDEPLFPSYLFVKVSNREYDKALQHSSIACYITIEGRPCPVPDAQIEAIRTILSRKVPFEVLNDQFESGQQVVIQSGPLAGLHAKVVERKGKRELILEISQTGHAVLITTKCKYLVM
jgi:transcription antitermination factor NusG